MIAIAVVLLALPLGLLLQQRTAANLAYIAAFGYCFTFQSTYLTTAWVRGNPDAGLPADGSPSLSYLAVTLAVYATGFGLVELGHVLRHRRDERRHEDAPPLAPRV
jgi:hypothetical protein